MLLLTSRPCVCWDYVSRNARSVEEWSSPDVVLVDFHAGLKVLSRWSPSSIAQSRLLEPSPSGGVVCARGDEEVTCCRRRSDLRFCRRPPEKEAREDLVLRDSVGDFDGRLGCVSDRGQFWSHPAPGTCRPQRVVSGDGEAV